MILFMFTILATSGLFPLSYVIRNAQAQSQGESSSDDAALQITNSDVRGAYEDETAAVSVIFPEGWSGVEVSQADGSIIVAAVSPDSIVTIEDLSDADPILNLIMAKKRSVDMSPGTVPPLIAEMNGEIVWDCTVISSRIILLNGVFTEELSSNCSNTSPDAPSEKVLRSILTETSDRWISLVLFTSPESLDASEAQFRSALGSLKVIGAQDVPVPFEQISFSTFNVNANGSIIPVDIKSTSRIAEFALDESKMMVSFTAEAVSRQGIAELTIGRVLEGPYVVTVNGRVWNDFDVFNEDNPRDSKIQIRYQEQESQILVTGTQVVPEFSFGSLLGSADGFPMIAFMGAALATLIVLTKLRAYLGIKMTTSYGA
jgi:hypothetical protein